MNTNERNVINGFDNMHPDFHGLTIRQQFAMAAMQGLSSWMRDETDAQIASASVCLADALLAELAKEPQP